ncbi:MAG: hypothetical protein EB075_09605 [Bacteroidetes bacterium]|nr:hypothetical protein [Bacteroidota bacterium]
MAHLYASMKNDVQPWDAHEIRDEWGHPMTHGKPIGSRVRHPRFRLLNGGIPDPNGQVFGKAWSYALACPIN